MTYELRRNSAMAAVAECGITTCNKRGSAVAWAYMQSFDVPRAAILRVLAFPQARRKPTSFDRFI